MGVTQYPPVYVSGTVTCVGGPHITALDVTTWCSDQATSRIQPVGTQPQPVNIPLNSGGVATRDFTWGGTTFEMTFAVTAADMTGTVTMEDGPCPQTLAFSAPRD